MELSISKAEDLQKLEGWNIKEATFQPAGADPSIALRLEHVAAQCPVLLTITAIINFGRSGNVMVANSMLAFKTIDIKEE